MQRKNMVQSPPIPFVASLVPPAGIVPFVPVAIYSRNSTPLLRGSCAARKTILDVPFSHEDYRIVVGFGEHVNDAFQEVPKLIDCPPRGPFFLVVTLTDFMTPHLRAVVQMTGPGLTCMP